MASSAAKKHHGAEKVSHGKLPEASADMNVTPLIDVLLVLLIIFMAALPLTQKGHDINLPLEVSKSQQQTDVLAQVVAEYTADRRLTINKQEVAMASAEGRSGEAGNVDKPQDGSGEFGHAHGLDGCGRGGHARGRLWRPDSAQRRRTGGPQASARILLL